MSNATSQRRIGRTPAADRDTSGLYQRIAPVYDAIYGALLQPGRRVAKARLAPRPGERILEVGVGTGFDLVTYPRNCSVVAIDVSAPMIARADIRRRRQGLGHVTLCRMDAALLAFAGHTFDAVYAPYVINLVSDPVAVAREMLRVCRPGGRVVLLNHFDHPGQPDTPARRALGRIASKLTGVNWNLALLEFMRESGLRLESIDSVNMANVSTVVVCRRA